MRVVIVCPYSWSVPGGVANHIESLGRKLRTRGHEVTVLAPAENPDPSIVAVGRTIGVPYNGSVARLAFGPRVAMRVRSVLRSAAPDVVHVHEPMAPSVGLIAALASHAPVVATFHASLSESRAYRVAAPVLRPLWKKIAVRIAVSEEARRTAEAVFAGPMRIVPNGIDLERFAGLPAVTGAPNILFIGRLEPRKGAGILLDAFAGVLRERPDATLALVGEGPQQDALRRRAAGLNVRFVGRLDQEALVREIAAASVVCAPSLGGESFGIVLLEAMAAGRAVVASAIPGYEAVVRDGVDGVLTPPGDAAGLTSALSGLLADPARIASFAQAGTHRAQRFSWDVVAGEVEHAYADALALAGR